MCDFWCVDFWCAIFCPLQAEDFERVATVNMIAACCEAFEVDLRRYWDFLEEKNKQTRTCTNET